MSSSATSAELELPSGGRFSILVGYDFADSSAYALEQAARMARRIPQCDLHVVHVAEERYGGLSHERLSALRRALESKARALGGWGDQRAGVHVRVGKAADEMAQLASDIGADLILLGRHRGPHVRELLRSAVAERLARKATCPVLIAGPKPEPAAAEATEPTIEPPCPACLHVRFSTKGQTWWCAQHSVRHVRAHHYSQMSSNPYDLHDSEVTPTGADF